MTFMPWSKYFNPRVDGESVADWLRREVDMLMQDDAPSRSITITPREARTLLALIEQPDSVVVTDARTTADALIETLEALVTTADSDPFSTIGHVFEHGAGSGVRDLVALAKAVRS